MKLSTIRESEVMDIDVFPRNIFYLARHLRTTALGGLVSCRLQPPKKKYLEGKVSSVKLTIMVNVTASCHSA